MLMTVRTINAVSGCWNHEIVSTLQGIECHLRLVMGGTMKSSTYLGGTLLFAVAQQAWLISFVYEEKMNSGNMSSRLDSSSDEDYPIYSTVAEALAANRLKVARENAARRLNREVGATTTSSSGEKPERKKERNEPTNCHEEDDIICISPEPEKKSLSLVIVYGLCEGKGRLFTFNISRTESLNVLKHYVANEVDAPACSVRLRLHGKLLYGWESLEQIEAGKTACIEFEIDELIKEAMQNIFKLKFVFQKRPAVVLYVDKTAEFSAVIGELCDRLKTDSPKFAVFFDGQRICETDTPSSLGMEDGDVVDVIFKN
ncbi:hypothetical protein M513_11920 [Trichuris suis]|uniref:Rad60/SUMO-like domain-containing protein n=1 Tax=Trichuris suis TaxID=68888 RepID=A0A085LQG7_9BILA|nr:hypothetical protein M513_11920 [Trichuris suis]